MALYMTLDAIKTTIPGSILYKRARLLHPCLYYAYQHGWIYAYGRGVHGHPNPKTKK